MLGRFFYLIGLGAFIQGTNAGRTMSYELLVTFTTAYNFVVNSLNLVIVSLQEKDSGTTRESRSSAK